MMRPAARDSGRLDALDGMRGLAALLVVVYHFTARWTPPTNAECLYPYGAGLYEQLPWLRFLGAYGVNLFFLISGFVMVMTLERSSGLPDFIVRRASRLWPTMLVCATLTTLFVNGSGITHRFATTAGWTVKPADYLLSVCFIDPAFIGRILRIDGLTWVDGVYWTLWIEVRFYALVAVVFWLAGSARRFAWGWLAVEALSLLVLVLSARESPWAHWTAKLILQPDYLSWFTIGIAAFFYWHGRVTLPVILMAILALIGLVVLATTHLLGTTAESLALEVAVLSTFALIILRTPLAELFRMRWAVVLGMASYPLYMFHEKVGIVFMNALADARMPVAVIPVVVVGGLIAVALTIHRYVELPAKSALLRSWLPLAERIEARLPGLAFARARGRQV